MDVVRTPDDRFANLPGWPYAPRYTEVRATADDPTMLRIAHVDEGPRDAIETVLLLHGEPSWGYLYRKMIPVLTGAGHRVIVPDLIGFGRSDKPTAMADYTYERHVDWMSQWLTINDDLDDITFFGQDWGGLVGLRVVTAFPERFSRIVVANTGLPTGDNPPGEAFLKWQRYSQTATTWNIGKMVEAACVSKPLDPAVVAAYDAPFPSDEYTAGSRIFPSLVPTSPTDPSAGANRAAWEVLKGWTKPLVTMFSDQDPVTAGGFKPFRTLVPGAHGQPHVTITDGGHFLQEDKGGEIADLMNKFMASSRH